MAFSELVPARNLGEIDVVVYSFAETNLHSETADEYVLVHPMKKKTVR
jgi:hypothetical protein